ncbi:MAG: GatB/YqeY domain-containing protein [bacterium]|nr:GatB/YqeY domain-containing protein [bacterium]
MIADIINQQIAEALKAGDETRLSTLRLLSSALNYELIAKQHELSQEEELAVVRKEAKQRKDSIEAFKMAQGKQTTSGTNQDARIKQEQAELAILEEYLPPQMSDADIEKIVDEVITSTGASTIGDMGKVIGIVMQKTAGRAEGSKVAKLVKGKLGI